MIICFPGVCEPEANCDPTLEPTTSLSSQAIKKELSEGRNIFLYPGGVAELFLSNWETEDIYFTSRKTCIKLAIEAGADILPCYIVGNTHMFHLMKGTGALSRALRCSITLFWGRFWLPIPIATKTIFAVGKPIRLPVMSNPSPEIVDKHHAEVLEDIKRLYYNARKHHPEYVNIPLRIL
eukprot:GHVN01059648.1.p1 GENE.GHVN01059648.1~~GHVN01059648.1.p1  ORF type:complete len:180 (+),score=18.39 GHVN01059648.1:949-1488(+)